jgi:hypothetical protein
MTRLRMRVALALVALGATACGPTPPFELAVHAVPGDVEYGAQAQPAPQSSAAGAGPSAPPPGAPPLIYGGPTPAPATFVPGPTATPAPACPAAPLDAVPTLGADASATVPPVAARYLWHEKGTYRVGGGAALPFSPQLTHTLTNVSGTDPNTGAYTFDVVDSAGGLDGLQTVTYSYQVIPPPQGVTDVQGASTAQASGLYLTGVDVQQSPLPQPRVARFAPPVQLLQFPASGLPSWSTAGSDSESQDTITLSGAVTGHASVDACGTLVDAWEVHATGSLVGPNQDLSLDLTFDVATQFGGLLVGEKTSITGTEVVGGGGPMQAVSSTVTAAISQVPQRRSGA